jgi:putative GTP pyrophosphokinase
MARITANEITEWHTKNAPLYEGFAKAVHSIVENLLKAQSIDHLTVTHRAKTLSSLLKKCDLKEYSTPSEITDIAGIRVITFIETDLAKVQEQIKGAFNIHEDKSINKSEELGIDKIGYRSIHYVCELGPDRAKLPELKPYKGLLFEIQIRTVLQHAWAEIEHDRNYKFSAVLPVEIRRRLNLISGILELADREFSSIATDIDNYTKGISKLSKSDELKDLEITSASLKKYLSNKQVLVKKGFDGEAGIILIKELNEFGIKKIGEINQILSDLYLEDAKKELHQKSSEYALLRCAMMYADIDKYFEKSWNKTWGAIGSTGANLLRKKHGGQADAVLRKYGISIYNEDKK